MVSLASKKFAPFKTMTEVQQRLQDSSVMVLDVGGSQDYKLNHLPGARWISRGWLEQKLPIHLPDKDQSLVLSCFDGNNSVLAVRTLAEMDYLNVDVLEGGVRAWDGGRLFYRDGPDRLFSAAERFCPFSLGLGRSGRDETLFGVGNETVGVN